MSLADPGQPYSCVEWQAVSSADSPLIINPNQAGNFNSSPYYNLYHDSWSATPTFVLIDHTMTIRAKPWTLENNSNTSSCDGSNNTIMAGVVVIRKISSSSWWRNAVHCVKVDVLQQLATSMKMKY